MLYGEYPDWIRRIFKWVDEFNIYGFTYEIIDTDLVIKYKCWRNTEREYWLDEQVLEDIMAVGVLRICLQKFDGEVYEINIDPNYIKTKSEERIEAERQRLEKAAEKERLEKILEQERIEKLRLEQEKYQHEKLKREIQNNKYLNGVIYKDIAERRGTIPAISKPIITKAQYIGGILQTPETFNMLVKYYDTVPECHYSIDVPEYRIEEDLEYIDSILEEFCF